MTDRPSTEREAAYERERQGSGRFDESFLEPPILGTPVEEIHPRAFMANCLIRAMEDGVIDDATAVVLQDIGRLVFNEMRRGDD